MDRRPLVEVSIRMTCRVTDSRALRDAASLRRGQTTSGEDDGWPGDQQAIRNQESVAVFELWPKEAIRAIVQEAIPGTFLDSESIGTVSRDGGRRPDRRDPSR